MAMRPPTLAVALGPVGVGTAVAFANGEARLGPALGALVGALLLQIASNFANDVYDSEKGADNDDRLGPPRAVQLGWLAPAQMKFGMSIVLVAALAVGLYLTSVAGWPVIAIGLFSMAGAVLYTGGPYPLGYHGLGDAAVFLFFGVIAVVGTEFVQSLQFSGEALAASVPVGALATAVLVVNNLRDIDGDREAGKRTLAVRLGEEAARIEYVTLLRASYALIPIYWWTAGRSPWVFLPWLTLPAAIRLIAAVRSGVSGAELNPLLGATARLGLFFSLLFAVGYAL